MLVIIWLVINYYWSVILLFLRIIRKIEFTRLVYDRYLHTLREHTQIPQKEKESLEKWNSKYLRTIQGISLRDQVRSANIREECKIQDVMRWTRSRRRKWRDHIDRMEPEKLAKWAKMEKPNTRRLKRRQLQKWKESWTSVSQKAW